MTNEINSSFRYYTPAEAALDPSIDDTMIRRPERFDEALSMVLSGDQTSFICELTNVSETTVRKMKRTIRELARKQFKGISWNQLKAIHNLSNTFASVDGEMNR